MGNQNNPMGGPGGRGGPSEQDREAERKRRMEERKFADLFDYAVKPSHV